MYFTLNVEWLGSYLFHLPSEITPVCIQMLWLCVKSRLGYCCSAFLRWKLNVIFELEEFLLPAYGAHMNIKQPFVSRQLKGNFSRDQKPLQAAGFLAHPLDPVGLHWKQTNRGWRRGVVVVVIRWAKIKAEAKVWMTLSQYEGPVCGEEHNVPKEERT